MGYASLQSGFNRNAIGVDRLLCLIRISQSELDRHLLEIARTMGIDTRFDLQKLRSFVMEELSNQNGLLPDAFPMTQRVLYKQGISCGIFYCLHGPRSVRLTAVLDTQTARVLFYDSKGHRTTSHNLNGSSVAVLI